MEYATWEKHKAALANESWTAWGKWPEDVQDAMRMIDPEHREFLRYDAVWLNHQGKLLLLGTIYRVNPSWPGPAKPETVAEYEDVPVFLVGVMYRFSTPGDDGGRWNLTAAPGVVGFAGYVMPDGLLAPCLIFDEQPDGTYRLRVPKAVRLRKEVPW